MTYLESDFSAAQLRGGLPGGTPSLYVGLPRVDRRGGARQWVPSLCVGQLVLLSAACNGVAIRPLSRTGDLERMRLRSLRCPADNTPRVTAPRALEITPRLGDAACGLGSSPVRSCW